MRVGTNDSAAMSPEPSCKPGRILVLGLGNILLSDEGVGVHIARQLQDLPLPYNVEVVDGGTASLDVLLLMSNIEKLVVVDALRTGKQAGTICRARLAGKEKRQQVFSANCQLSLHQIGLVDALAAVGKMGYAPKEIVVIGVEPKRMDWGLELTDEVKQKVPEVINILLKEVEDVIYPE